MEHSCHPKLAESWASPVTCYAVLATFLDSSISISWIHSAGSAAKKKLSWKLESFMQELSWRYVDENWEGSLKSRLLSGVISQNSSGDCKSSMCVVQTLY